MVSCGLFGGESLLQVVLVCAPRYFSFFFHAVYYLRRLAPSFSRNSGPGSHIRLFPLPPPPLRYAPCIFIARRINHSLPSSTRVELCLYPRYL